MKMFDEKAKTAAFLAAAAVSCIAIGTAVILSAMHFRRPMIVKKSAADTAQETAKAPVEAPTDTPQAETTQTIFPINVNEADAAQLTEIPYMGEVLAARVIAYRESLGGAFTDLSQLTAVSGISQNRLEGFLPYITL